jgi:glycerol-3-phosphate dehydrogenase
VKFSPARKAVTEGVETAPAVVELARKRLGVDLPICKSWSTA